MRRIIHRSPRGRPRKVFEGGLTNVLQTPRAFCGHAAVCDWCPISAARRANKLKPITQPPDQIERLQDSVDNGAFGGFSPTGEPPLAHRPLSQKATKPAS